MWNGRRSGKYPRRASHYRPEHGCSGDLGKLNETAPPHSSLCAARGSGAAPLDRLLVCRWADSEAVHRAHLDL